jgi:Ca-activated chloride channel family protein
MSRSVIVLTVGMTVALVAGCADRGSRPATQPASPAAAPESVETAFDVVVTGARLNGRAPAPLYAMAPPPPPPAPLVAPPPGFVPRPADAFSPLPYHDGGRDRFTAVQENPFKQVSQHPVSTFSLDVDTASYAFTRASLNRNVLPQPDAVRPEEMINYFPYDYAPARDAARPFSTNVAVFPSPWSPGRLLVRIGVKGYELPRAARPHANLVFLIDTSGSMNEPNKLPLVKQSLGLLLDRLDAHDRVAIVTYAGNAGVALEPTPAGEKAKILGVLDRLGAGGSTAGAEGIRQAYALAEQNLDPAGLNRVILATDGDFNVGITDQNELKGYIERERGKGVFLSVLGFGMGNYNDALMQTLAQNGNGIAAYIDTLNEARKTLAEATSTLFPIAKDAKVQVEFNAAAVSEYRLIGYETRMLDREDFNNDKVDAGDVGSGQTVTALYEVVPAGGPRTADALRYARPVGGKGSTAGELGFVKIRYKLPKADTSKLIAVPIGRAATVTRFEDAPRDARFAAAVAGFAELLRGGRYAGSLRYDDVARIAVAAKGEDSFGYRAEFIQLVRAAKTARAMAALDQ